MAKIKVEGTVVELDGDEMTRIIWQFIKDQLILPYLDVEPRVLRPGHREARRDRRPDHRRRGQRHQAARRRRQVRHDHAGRGAGRGVRPEEDVALARTGRSATSSAASSSASRSSCPNVPRLVPGWTKPIVVGRHAFGDQYRATDFRFPGEGTLTITFTPKDGSEPIEHEVFQSPGRRRRDGDVQPRRLDPRLRPGLDELRRCDRELPGLPVDEEHDPQGLRRPVQGPVPGGLRGRVQGQVRGRRHHLRAPADRRHGRRLAQVGGRLRLGVQELRRRRAVRHRGAGLRLARPDDVGAA